MAGCLTRLEEWTREQVHQWLCQEVKVDQKYADLLFEQEVSGEELVCYELKHFCDLGIKHGPAVKISKRLEDLKNAQKEEEEVKSTIKDGGRTGSGCLCSLHPFDNHSEFHRYIQHYVLPPETGSGNLIDPIHEHKFLGGVNGTDKKDAFKKKLFPFAAACMNSRTNGTIHFGVADSKGTGYSHGEIIGISVEKDKIIDALNHNIESYFGYQADKAKKCIRQPRFVEVLSPDNTSSDRCVIEVDVVPSHSIVQGKIFYITDGQKKNKNTHVFIREGASTRDIKKDPKEFKRFEKNLKQLDLLREQAERRPKLKSPVFSNQGERLKNLLTCGGGALNYYDFYFIVINKSHPEQLHHLQFISKLKRFFVLDFDPESAVSGSCSKCCDSTSAIIHMANECKNVPRTLTETLQLYSQSNWMFCNGKKGSDTDPDKPLHNSEWLKSKAAKMEETISFLCNRGTLQRGRFLVIFLLLSTVEAMIDPVFDTFMSFYKFLEGSKHILSMCSSESAFGKWKDFIRTRCGIDMSRHICKLEVSEINGTILDLEKHSVTNVKLLPSGGGSSVVLQPEDEKHMTALKILCQNERENEQNHSPSEEQFHSGLKAACWDFFVSEKEKSFIKRDKYRQLKDMIRYQTKDPSSTCVMVNLFHHPGCGGTTLAMHVMWNLRKEFRCAVLKDNSVPKTEVAKQVADLMRCGKSENSVKTPVLLLVDDFEETENTQLEQSIKEIAGKICLNALIIILNCLRAKDPQDSFKKSVSESLFITAALSKDEQDAFGLKLKELKATDEKPENFYCFMAMKTNFNKAYAQNVVSFILKDFDKNSKQSQLLSILALLNSRRADASISVLLCEDFLEIKPLHWGKESVLEKMEPFSCLLLEFTGEGPEACREIRLVHQQFAAECVNQLEKTYSISRQNILRTICKWDLIFRKNMEKDDLKDSVERVLMTGQYEEEDSIFYSCIDRIILRLKDVKLNPNHHHSNTGI
ncbi:sterile alpha motif domain-containing protein 9-like [Chanos chanos]|uniref:Sterile alpha motif domain-containing protein 9-like n=1 Tax=Chanos chanos TaxID=29144 RepID=A0A6J2VDM6_CHACN|nr:sterile alpha motif domain-containing protein 9-like [Chanos chanos]